MPPKGQTPFPIELLSVVKQVYCPLCGEKLRLHWDRVVDPDSQESFAIQQCDGCTLMITSPAPVDIGRYYSPSYHGGRHGMTESYCDRRRLKIMKDSAIPSSTVAWLDVGSGDGTLLQAAAKLGWRVRGVEKFLSKTSIDETIVYKTLEEAAIDGPYDGISLWHVLEHLVELDKDLTTIRKMLKPTGVLLIAVPDASSPQAKHFGPHWLHLDVPRHLYHFTNTSLNRLLSKQGFRAERLSATELEYDLIGWVQSSMNKWGFERNGFFKMLTKRKTAASVLSRIVTAIFGSVLCIARIPRTLIDSMRGRGSMLIVRARIASIPSEAANV